MQINIEELKIRPSSIDNFYGCAYQWGRKFLGGESSIPNSRASVGTAIHSGVETLWRESIDAKKKVMNKTAAKDAAMASWKEQTHDGVEFGDDNEATCAMDIVKGIDTFVEDIVPFTDVPDAVEIYLEVPIDNPFVKSLGGTLDYLGGKTLADVKTSKRKSGPQGHVVQQSTYTYLAEANGYPIERNLIQQVVLKANPEGAILELEPNIAQAKYLINGMLDTLKLVHMDIAPVETILRPNPKYMFCSPKFCAFYNTCPGVQGEVKPGKIITKVKL